MTDDAYKAAGVDKKAGYDAVSRIKQAVGQTHNARVLNHLGGFGAMYDLSGFKHPVLVSGTDGVGTKIMLALQHNWLDGIGQDCFAMCANDILCHGAKPLYFLDYLACGQLKPETAASIITGMANACEQTDTALVGGEMAEMPGLYQIGDYDVAGFCVGAVERDQIITPEATQAGDMIIGLPSEGLHSNGFSLVRKCFPDTTIDFENRPLYQTLLTPTKLYINSVHAVLSAHRVHGMAHITGGGLAENLPRAIRDDLQANISYDQVPSQPIFDLLRQQALSEDDLWGTFNMGVGFCLIVPAEEHEVILSTLTAAGEAPFVLGELAPREAKVQVCSR